MLPAVVYEYDYVLIFITVFIALLFLNSPKWKNIPPGPYGLPIIGNLKYLKPEDQIESFKTLRDKYGDVFRLQVNGTLFIVINGYETLRDAFIKHGDTFNDRPNTYTFMLFSKGKGKRKRIFKQ